MSSSENHTQPQAEEQLMKVLTEEWEKLVKDDRFPKDLEAQVRQLGAWKRTRGLKCVTDLLRALLVYALGGSFRDLGMWATIMGIGQLCERAWRKRFGLAHAWVGWLLVQHLASATVPLWLAERTTRRVLLIDGTRLQTEGGSGDDIRVHLSYDLLAGRMRQVVVTDRFQAESAQYTLAQADDILVGDSGYGKKGNVGYLIERKADGMFRFSAQAIRLEDEQGQVIDLRAELEDVAEGTSRSLTVWLGFPRFFGERKVKDDLICCS